jgi:glycosyltransferase involved in cell wall biosynthesis
MLELGREMQDAYQSLFATFQEEGRCRDFVRTGRERGFDVYAIQYDFPRMVATYRELLSFTQTLQPDVLCCHGYKPNFFGRLVARRLRIPIISVSHGWTGESYRVRIFDALDRFLLRRMDRVVCVSEKQAQRVRKAGVPKAKTQVIHCAVRSERFAQVDSAYRGRMEQMFPEQPRLIVGAAGRLSPEKGFRHLIDAAHRVVRQHPDAAFVLFGDGPLRQVLQRQIDALGLSQRFRLAGFCADLDHYYPHLEMLVLPSYTEGLPNVVLEAFAAGIPVVATAVGGTPEVVQDGINGYLVAPADPDSLARRITDLLRDSATRHRMGTAGMQLVREAFSFASQANDYSQVIDSLLLSRATHERAEASSHAATHSES